LWDVDGSGLRRIEDVSVAAALRSKVNSFNLKVGAGAVCAALVLAAAPLLF